MSYEITNTGCSIRFVNEYGFFYLMKNDIRAIQSVRDNMVKIDTGCCFNSIFLYTDNVIIPNNNGPESLAEILNEWLTEFLQGYPNPVIPPTE